MSNVKSMSVPHNTTCIHSESKKLRHYTFVHNFDKYWPIFTIFPPLCSARNLQQNLCHIANQTLDVSLHYLAKLKIKNLNFGFLYFARCKRH